MTDMACTIDAVVDDKMRFYFDGEGAVVLNLPTHSPETVQALARLEELYDVTIVTPGSDCENLQGPSNDWESRYILFALECWLVMNFPGQISARFLEAFYRLVDLSQEELELVASIIDRDLQGIFILIKQKVVSGYSV